MTDEHPEDTIESLLNESGIRSFLSQSGFGLHSILEGTTLRRASTLEWMQWFETADRHVRLTEITPDCYVSTVAVGIGNRPLETMVFGGVCDGHRYCHETYDQAVACHEEVASLICREEAIPEEQTHEFKTPKQETINWKKEGF